MGVAVLLLLAVLAHHTSSCVVCGKRGSDYTFSGAGMKVTLCDDHVGIFMNGGMKAIQEYKETKNDH